MVISAIKIHWFTCITFIKYLKVMTKRIFLILNFKGQLTQLKSLQTHTRVIKELKISFLQILCN